MSKKFIKITRYVLYALISNVIYGLIMYYVYKWLVVYSLLYAYLGTLALIIIGLVWDELNHKLFLKTMQKKEYAVQLEKDFIFRLYLDSFISFKTIIYLFYLFVLIVSQIIKFNPELVNENFANYVLSFEYGILFIIAFDMVVGQFLKDRERMKEISAKFKEFLAEN